MGKVYKAEQAPQGRIRAERVLNPNLAGAGTVARSSCRGERCGAATA